MNFNYGHELYDFFILPTIRIHSRYNNHIEIELVWFKWFVGVQIWKKEKYRRKNIGKYLLDYFIESVKEHRLNKIEAELEDIRHHLMFR